MIMVLPSVNRDFFRGALTQIRACRLSLNANRIRVQQRRVSVTRFHFRGSFEDLCTICRRVVY